MLLIPIEKDQWVVAPPPPQRIAARPRLQPPLCSAALGPPTAELSPPIALAKLRRSPRPREPPAQPERRMENTQRWVRRERAQRRQPEEEDIGLERSPPVLGAFEAECD